MRRESALFFVAVALAISANGASSDAQEHCGPPYRGFDSRLSPKVVGRLPVSESEVRGFEMVGGNAVVALSDRLVAFRDDISVEVDIPSAPVAIFTGRAGDLWLQTAGGVLLVGQAGPVPSSGAISGRLLASGSDLTLRVVESSGRTALLVHARDGSEFELADYELPLRAASWGPEGLTAVVGDRLVTWKSGAPDMKVWLSHPSLTEAHDVCRLGDGHAIVTLAHQVLHVSTETVSGIVAGFPARCRFAGSDLFLLDEQSGLVWRVGGVDKLGSAKADEAHAEALLRGSDSAQSETFRLPEAARLIGCNAARAARPRQMAQREVVSPPSSSAPPTRPKSSVARGSGMYFQPAWLSGSGGTGLTLRVDPGSAAATAGLQSGDRLTSIGGRVIDTIDAAEAALAPVASGSTVSIIISRGGQRLTKSLVMP